jgi:uncharacterized hydrophobic protein (TIGR00271 family)
MKVFEILRHRVALREGTDVPGTIARVTAGASLSAENFWLLGCSAVLASIGLDVGSAAVVIGAMLISPLMGPILGVGLGVGVTNRGLLQRSLRELGLATVLVLAASGLYFLLSPLASPTTELIARTRPTLLDVGIAFFGGIAGIVAGSRKVQSMALPGVAIATALMPPLCTAGFGLATRNWAFFFGAFYLYALNAVFIALSTFFVVRLLRFPHHEETTPEARQRERRLVAAVAVLAALPSTWFLYQVVRGLKEQQRIGTFIEHEVVSRGRAVPQWEQVPREPAPVLRIYIAGRPIEGAAEDSLRTAALRYDLGNMQLELVQSDISAEDLQRFRGEVQRNILQAVSASVATRDSLAQSRQRQDSLRVQAAAREVARAFPEVTALAFAPRSNLLASDSTPPPTMFATFATGTRPGARRQILGRIEPLLRQRLDLPTLVVEVR